MIVIYPITNKLLHICFNPAFLLTTKSNFFHNTNWPRPMVKQYRNSLHVLSFVKSQYIKVEFPFNFFFIRIGLSQLQRMSQVVNKPCLKRKLTKCISTEHVSILKITSLRQEHLQVRHLYSDFCQRIV